MIVHYDSLNRFEKPTFTLCQPGSTYANGRLTKTIGALVDHEAEEIVFNFNALSELNMRANLVPREDKEENEYVLGIFKAIKNRRLIYAENIGYFVITNVSDGYDDGVSYKDITAKSVDAELQNRMVPFIADGTYRFSSDGTPENKGIFDTIVDTLPLWKIGHVDTSVASKWRTFEDVDESQNCLAFLIDKVQVAYDCIILFDIINRIINVYDKDNYIRQTDIHITKHDLINSIDINENADDIYTAISALGEDSVSIAAVNPIGTNVIYKFDYYFNWMSDSLREKVVAWQSAVDSAFDEHCQLSQEYYQYLESSANLSLDIDKINTQITMYSRCRDNIVAQSSTDIVKQYNTVIEQNGGDAISIDKEIDATLQEIDKLIEDCNKSLASVQASLDAASQEMETKKSAIDKIHDELNIFRYFTEDEYTELCLYIYEGSYSDEYVVITESMSYTERFEQMKLLYDRAKSQLEKVSEPTREFNIDVESFIFIKEFEAWSKQLETGCLINVELDIADIAAIFLASIAVNYDDHSMKLTFGNRYNRFDPKSLFDNMLGKISKSANTISNIKDAIYPIKNGELSQIREALQVSRDLTMNAALSTTNEEVIIDASGYTGKRLLSEGVYDEHQIKIVSNSIVFTNDGWSSCSTAIGDIVLGDGTTAYGINAKTVFGDMIIGGGLKIYDKDGNEMLSVLDGIKTNISDTEKDLKSQILQTVNGLTLSVSNGDDNSTLTLKSGDTILSSEKIEIKGLVKFTDLENSNGTTTIHGGNIKTRTITADQLDVKSINIGDLNNAETYTTTITNNTIQITNVVAQNLQVNAANIKGTLIADQIDATNLKVAGANVTGTLSAAEISAGKITAGTNNAKITFNGVFTAPSATISGSITATSGKIGNWEIIAANAPGNEDGLGLLGSAFYTSTLGHGGYYGIGFDCRKAAFTSSNPWNVIAVGQFTPNASGNTDTAKGLLGGWSTAAFRVQSDGAVHCSNINASGGTIGGWHISNAEISGGIWQAEGAITKSDDFISMSTRYLQHVYFDAHEGMLWSTLSDWDWVIGSAYDWYNTSSYESDANVKNTISSLDTAYENLFNNLSPCKYKYNHGTSGRFHTGFIAQEVAEAVKNAGLTTQDFAGIVHLDKPNVNGCEWLLRRDEFVALNTWQIQKLKKRVAELESKLESL